MKQYVDHVSEVQSTCDAVTFILVVKMPEANIVNAYNSPIVQWSDTILLVVENVYVIST